MTKKNLMTCHVTVVISHVTEQTLIIYHMTTMMTIT